MVTCPRCGKESQPTGKKWKYGVFDTKLFYCNQCDKKFNAYYRDGELIYTIPKSSL